VVRQTKKKLTRDEKAELIYSNLMSAAARVVGQLGYAASSIARVTQEAGVSQGTFYNYFEDRQALFDEILPHVGGKMTGYIVSKVLPDLVGADREVARFQAYCQFLEENPGFYRILYEAEVFAPEAHRKHIERIRQGYLLGLKRSMEAGHIKNFSSDELDDVISILLGARAYLSLAYKKDGKMLSSTVDTYRKLVTESLFTV